MTKVGDLFPKKPRATMKPTGEGLGMRFVVRTPEELARMSDADVRYRLAWVKAGMNPDMGGLAFANTAERKHALAERRQLLDEMMRRQWTRKP